MASKYAPLGDYLRHQPMTEVPMTFTEIERVTGVTLPPKAQNYAAWWSNNPSNNVMTKVWLAAGYKTERVDLGGRRLVFRRVRAASDGGDSDLTGKLSPPQRAGSPRRHPIFGCMKGTITIAPGVDLTEPADPSWGADN